MQPNADQLKELKKSLSGELHYDEVMRILYATDASAYRELPLAVAIPKTKADIIQLINFANRYQSSLIPRTAGTSLAGQVVGNGIVVDVSQHFTKILEVNREEGWVVVEPGVIRDELNMHLKKFGLFFGPETSTANRAMIGGMVGNNSCGSNSVVYGSTREHLMEVEVILADGTETVFKEIDLATFNSKCQPVPGKSDLETSIYQEVDKMLQEGRNQKLITDNYPKKSIPRRNTGYALDLLLDSQPYNASNDKFNFCQLIAGSEGTLAFMTAIKLHVDPLPPVHKGLLCIHCDSVEASLHANLIALKYKPSACELMDHYILECTKKNVEQNQNRFFVQGDPKAILVVELFGTSMDDVHEKADKLTEELKSQALGYHFPLVTGSDIPKVWTLRRAGLGLLANIAGDAKAVPVIEDTAVAVEDLPAYIADFNEILKKHNLYSVHYAHAGSGELHLRPIINLKTKTGNQLFKTIADEIAALVKKYRGSLSGEHGDGRLRGEYIKYMVGEETYQLIEKVKRIWDPNNIFNPGKIVDTPPMNDQLRYKPGQEVVVPSTFFRFSDSNGILSAAEQCNGSGDCRKTPLSGGTMCPSYMATRNEMETTRARANIVREVITQNDQINPFSKPDMLQVMDLCLSCKGCKSECPSNVDIAKLKAEASFQYYKIHGIPFRTKMIGNFTRLYAMGAIAPSVFNFFAKNVLFANLIKKVLGFAVQRPLPLLQPLTLRKWYAKNKKNNFGIPNNEKRKGQVNLFCDEFTNLTDCHIGIKTIKLLTKLGYDVNIPDHYESGRTYLSKGLLVQAKDLANKNVSKLADQVNENSPLIGLEPSAVLTIKDEYLDLVDESKQEQAALLAANTSLAEEFMLQEIEKGKITKDQFSTSTKEIKLHGHCHQKALSSVVPTKKLLSFPKNFNVQMIPSGCCGMAGSFGYEKEHYELSMNIGEMVLFPAVRSQPAEVVIAAPGTSCRHQIKDGTKKEALHPLEIMWEALV